MMEAYKNNEDIHSKTAQLVFQAETEAEIKEKALAIVEKAVRPKDSSISVKYVGILFR